MFESIKNKVNQWVNPQEHTALESETLALFDTLLEPLADVDSTLPNRVLNYLVNGQNPEVLLELQQRSDDKAGALLGFPGTLTWYYGSYNLNKAQEKRLTSIKNTRIKLYLNWFEKISYEHMLRYGKFLAAVTQEKNLTILHPETPIWFTYIAVDAFKTTADQQYGKEVKKRLVWSLQQLEQLLAIDVENPKQVLISTLFERDKDTSSYYSQNLRPIYQLPDTVSYLNQHADLLKQIIPQLSATAQNLFLDDFAKEHIQDFLVLHPELIVSLALSSSKTVRESATALLTHLKAADSQHYLQHFLTAGNTKQRGYAADLLARLGEQNREVLQQAFAQEAQKSVQQSIQSALQRLESLEQMGDDDFEIPTWQPIVARDIPDSFIGVIEENYQALLEKAKQSAEEEIEQNKTEKTYKSSWRQDHYKRMQKINIEKLGKQLFDYINGHNASGRHNSDHNILTHQKKLFDYPEYSLVHALRLNYHRNDWINWDEIFSRSLKPEHYENLDLRQLAQAMKEAGFKHAERLIAKGFLENYYDSSYELSSYIQDDHLVVPFFMENMDFIAEALGLLPDKSENRWRSFEPLAAIQLLQKFPHIPKQFIPRLLELALGENKRLRFDAQELLQKIPQIQQRAIEALDNGKQEIRITAVEWLARLQHADAIPALYNLLKKEKKEIVIAAILTALEQLGEDISGYLSADVLLKDAEKGLKAKIASSFTWFDLNSLPQLQWQNGKIVDAKIIQWWVVLADKLKDPVPNALLQRYLGLLNEKSQQALSLFLLQSFIYQDTRNPTLEEAMEVAHKEAPNRLSSYQDSFKRWGQKYPEYYGRYEHITLEQVVEEIKKERLAIYLGSAIKSKGMLALTFKTQGSVAVKMLQDYMKQHYQRRAQIEAMLSSFAVSDDPLIIQLLLGLSRRYRTASVQNLAKQLVEQIAERNQWTSDELADRTIPTAGLDDTGILTLDYGTRTLTAYVDDKDKFVLKNEEGKVIKALPAARQGDDEALIKEAKSLLSSSKKEFKQVLDLQTQRLYEAMCSERTWSSQDWQEYLFAHPIMKRLIQRLVWLEVSETGEILKSFRPSEDGCLLNLDDDEVELQTDSYIKVAHGVLISDEDADAWQAHFKDYKVKFLFDQMTHRLPEFKPQDEQIEDRKGWLTDTFTLRGVVTKLGYQRASIEDGGSFDSYFKSFSQIGLSAVIRFSGSYVPEENLAAVLYELSFEKQNVRSWRESDIRLADVPPVLVAEAYADYLKVAEACSGFDPEWQKKTPW